MFTFFIFFYRNERNQKGKSRICLAVLKTLTILIQLSYLGCVLALCSVIEIWQNLLSRQIFAQIIFTVKTYCELNFSADLTIL